MRLAVPAMAIAAALGLAGATVGGQQRGGEDETGPYAVVESWPRPWATAGHVWGSQPAVFAQSPDRIFIGARGELKLPTPLPRTFAGFWGSLGQRATEPKPEYRNCIMVVDRTGRVVEAWTEWDALFDGSGPHKIRISPYDADHHVWVVNDGRHQIHKFSNDGKQLELSIGEAGVAGDDATHLGAPQDLAFLPDGSILVADGLRNARVAKFDKDGRFLGAWGSRGHEPAQLSGVHAIAVDRERRVYVADRSNHRIQVFDERGALLDIWPNLRQPNDIFISGDDRIWVVDGANARLLQFDREGRRQYWWGTWGTQPGQFWEPHQISVDADDNLYIADSFGGRTQMYRPAPGADRSKLITLGAPPRR